MIIIKLMGGLGNQLQQYALYCKLNKVGRDVKMDLAWFDEKNQAKMSAPRNIEINKFTGVSYKVCSDSEKRNLLGNYYDLKDNLKNNFDNVEFSFIDILKILISKLTAKFDESRDHHYYEYMMYDERILASDNLYLEGYFACEHYFKDIIPELRNMLVLPPKAIGDSNPIIDNGVSLYNNLVSEISSCNSISVHLRRGDYLDSENAELFGNICTEEYYDVAIKYVLDKGDPRNSDLGTSTDIKTCIYIFSDDSIYASEFASGAKLKYGVETKVIDINKGDDSCYDIHLMSLCKHNVCANSTFSFWGARLNSSYEKIIVRPTKQRNNQDFVYEDMKKLWSGWVFVSPDGKIYE